MKKIYDDILFSTDLFNKKKGVKALASYGRKAIPFIQELRSVETNEGMKNYMFDAITQINKASRKKERRIDNFILFSFSYCLRPVTLNLY